MDDQHRLPLHEWMAVIAILLLLMALTVVVLFSADTTPSAQELGPPHHTISQEIEVFVEGSVLHPGSYILPRGATIKDLLEKAQPNERANLTRLNLDKKLRKGQIVKVSQAKTKAPKKKKSL